MTTITVEALGSDVYRVTVDDDSGTSVHDVTATPADVARFGGGAPAGDLIRASFRFLLEREPKESILGRFDLPVIARYFPEYPERIGEHL